MFACWFGEAGVLELIKILSFITYWPIHWLFLCKVDHSFVKTYYSFVWWNLKFHWRQNLINSYLLKGCWYSLFVFLRENFRRFLLTCLKNAGGWGRSIALLEGGTSRGWNKRGIWDLTAEVFKACSDFAIPGCQIHDLSYMEAKENGRDMKLSLS